MLLSIIAVIITAANTSWIGSLPQVGADGLRQLAIFNQVVASGLALIGVVTYRGRRLRPNYKIGHPPIWTLGRAFNVVALIASLSVILFAAAPLIGW